MDDAVGAVLRTLRDKGLGENTLIFFISDNGGPTRANTSRNDPLRGFKGQVLQGGIRVPFMIQWKGRLPAGKVYEEPVISLDILPTALVAVGGHVPHHGSIDGVDLMPFLTGKRRGSPHEALYWRFNRQEAIRKGEWKMVRLGPGQQWLFNLEGDISESKDLSFKYPDKFRELERDWAIWNAQLRRPLWRQTPQARRQR